MRTAPIAYAIGLLCAGLPSMSLRCRMPAMNYIEYLRAGGTMLALAVRMPGAHGGGSGG